MTRRITTRLLNGLLCIAVTLPMATAVTIGSAISIAQDAQACPMRRSYPEKTLVKTKRRKSSRSLKVAVAKADRLYAKDQLEEAYPLYRGVWRQLSKNQQVKVLEKLVISAQELGKLDAALNYARNLVRRSPKHVNGYRLLVQVLEERPGDKAQAEMIWASRRLKRLERAQVARAQVATKTRI